MKSITVYIAGFLVLLATMCPGLIHSVFVARQASVRARMKRELEMQFLQTVEQKVDSVRWAKPGKEIWVGNSLFDIKSTTLHNGVYTFTGLFDKDETILVKSYKEQKDKSKNGNRILTALLQWVKNKPTRLQVLFSPERDLVSLNYICHNPSLPSVYIGISTPPPEKM